jgi:hypothetical protein
MGNLATAFQNKTPLIVTAGQQTREMLLMEPYLFGRVRVSGPDSEHRSYRSFASFRDPDGNGWLFQELTTRLPGRIDSAATSFASASDLASALRRAAAAHGEHEKRTGGQRDENWPDWYAEYMVSEQSGKELPK